jgi:tripartite ATP-independent transporter DctM subunit
LLAAIIPPSALAVLLGSLAEVSIAALLVGGLVPGLVMSLIYAIYIYTRVRLNPSLAPEYASEGVTWTSRLVGLVQISPLAVIVLMVMGFIIFGVTTPSEAAATGAIGAFIVAAIYRRLSFSVTRRALMGTLYIAGMVFLIITGATALGQLLSLTGATREFLRVLTELPVPDVVLVIIIQMAVMLLGFFIDQLSIMLVAIPILIPIVSGLGIDPVWFWVIFLMNISVAAITPPFGLVLFALKGVVPKATMTDLYRAALPFIALDIVAIGFVIAFPGIATWLPNKIA